MNIKKILLATFFAFGPMTGSMLGTEEATPFNLQDAESFLTNSQKNSRYSGLVLRAVDFVRKNEQLSTLLDATNIDALNKSFGKGEITEKQLTTALGNKTCINAVRKACQIYGTYWLLFPQIEALQRRIEGVNAENANLKKEITKKNENNEQLSQQINEVDAEIQKLNESQEKYKETNREQAQKIAAMKQELGEKAYNIRSLEAKVRASEAEKSKAESLLRTERKQHQEELEKVKNIKYIKDLEQKVKTLNIKWTDVIPTAVAIEKAERREVNEEERYYLSGINVEQISNYCNFLLAVFSRIKEVARLVQQGREHFVYNVNYKENVEPLHKWLKSTRVFFEDKDEYYFSKESREMLFECKYIADTLHMEDRPLIEMYLAQFNKSLTAPCSRSSSETFPTEIPLSPNVSDESINKGTSLLSKTSNAGLSIKTTNKNMIKSLSKKGQAKQKTNIAPQLPPQPNKAQILVIDSEDDDDNFFFSSSQTKKVTPNEKDKSKSQQKTQLFTFDDE